MKLKSLFPMLFLLPAVAYGQYHSGWNVQSFYSAVQECKRMIVVPQSEGFIKAEVKHGESADKAMNEAIRMSPVFDAMSGPVCFCVVNEIAKDHPPKDFPQHVDVRSYMKIPRCTSAMKSKVDEFRGKRDVIRSQMLP